MANAENRQPSTGEERFLSELPLVDRVIAFVCRRHHLTAADAEDFASHAKIKLIENDYAVLGKFKERSSLKTFLTVTVHRLFLDYRNASWGKWRPSADARRSGAVGILLEQLLNRDGYRLDEAFEILSTNHRLDISREGVEQLVARLPASRRRHFQDEQALVNMPAPGSASDLAESRERAVAASRMTDALKQQLAALDPQDRLILTLRFTDGRSVATIATMLRLEPKPLYRRVERLLRELRTRLEEAGVCAREVAALLGTDATDHDEQPRDPESATLRPSIEGRGTEWS
jgi:RNA polymerase sigma factor for flagellar operon FliA